MKSEAAPKHVNRLARETSPYLLQHAHNPVDWYPWGPEALSRAKAEDKPILLSIGYAACHWCHVMERESFESEEVARLMNEHFVPIKVDREERPDLDEIYMAATVAMSGSGGWPMTVFLTPDQRPFFAGTYFPPVDRYGRPGFKTLLEKIAALWKTERQNVLEQASELTEHVRQQSEAASASAVSADVLSSFVRQLGAGFDPRWGGFGPAPKFPAPAALSLLFRHHGQTNNERSLEMARRTLDGMKNGGIYDQLGGGFARYSTDERWLVPHFEKMLYDNAQLARVYLEAYQVTRDDEYRRIAEETLDYVLREMQAPAGGYYSATDADSEGEEGKFFVFTPEEVVELLGAEEADRFNLHYDVSARGNWEGKSILNTPRPLAVSARELGISENELQESLAASRQKLYEARSKRVPPLLDDKVLVGWNALMIGAMAEGHRVLRAERFLNSAERAARFVFEHMRRPDGGLFRTARDGRAHLDAYLEDYAYLSDALIDLYEAGGASEWLHRALALAERMIEDFGDPEGGAFYFTAEKHEKLIVRTREGNDGAVPNPNAVAARALGRLSFHFAREPLRLRAQQAIEAYGRLIERAPRAFANAIGVVDFLLEPPLELAFVGTPGEAAYEALLREVAAHYLPNRIIAHIDPGAPPPPELSAPLVEGKGLVRGAPALYVCRNFTCQAPVSEPGEVRTALERGQRDASGARVDALSAGRLSGAATAEKTLTYTTRYRTRHGPDAYTKLGKTELSVSRIGFGAYRIDEGNPAHRAALAKALREGANLIDTSTNYGDGGSERLIGQVLADLVRKRELLREEIVLVSKIGYVQGQNLEIANEREARELPFPEMVKYADEVWHCMHPEWLEDQLTRSLARLGVETLDVCLVHNPEYYFSDAVKRGEGPLGKLRDEFYRRLARAFGHFEKEIARGRISSYGVSSNSAVSSADDREATELYRMLEAAREAGGESHHFRVLELPMNLAESGGLFQKNNGPERAKSVLELAREQGIATLVNRPLNAISERGLIRLADPPAVADAPPFDLVLDRVAELENEFRTSLAPALRAPAGGPSPKDFFRWAEQLRGMPARIESLEQWSEIEDRAIAPHVAQLIDILDHTFEGQLAPSYRDWRGRYLKEMEGLLAALRKRAADRSSARGRALHAAIDPTLPEERRSESLSRKALFVLKGLPAVSVVLVGMREPGYVDDALGMMAWPPLEHPEKPFEAVKQANIPGFGG